MRWSWTITRVAGIDIAVHATFALLILWIGVSVWRATQSTPAVLQGLVFVLVLFICVVLHELGHALTARRFGVTTQRITLLPIGGVASMERMPENPRHELLVAVAGPMVNLGIAAVLGLWLYLTGTPLPQVPETPGLLFADSGAFLYQLLFINILLAVFNLLPAFPMDGGRVLRAALAIFTDPQRATRRAAFIGQTLALSMFLLGLLYNPILMLIAVFVWLGAAAESSNEQLQSALHGLSAGECMVTRFAVLDAHDPLQRAIDLTVKGDQKHFPVTGDGQTTLRLLTQKQLLQALQEHGEQSPVGEHVEEELATVERSEPMEKILSQLQSTRAPLIGVTEQGRLVGVLHLENITELMRIDEAVKAHRRLQGQIRRRF